MTRSEHVKATICLKRAEFLKLLRLPENSEVMEFKFGNWDSMSKRYEDVHFKAEYYRFHSRRRRKR